MPTKGEHAPPAQPEFDSPEYDALFEDTALAAASAAGAAAHLVATPGTVLQLLPDRLTACLATRLASVHEEQAQEAQQLVVASQAVDAVLESALTVLDMLYVGRDDRAVTMTSLQAGVESAWKRHDD
jgi:hypothetical protein